MVSFVRPEPIRLVANVCQSFCLNKGAFSPGRRNAKLDFAQYFFWVDRWIRAEVYRCFKQ